VTNNQEDKVEKRLKGRLVITFKDKTILEEVVVVVLVTAKEVVDLVLSILSSNSWMTIKLK